MATPDVEKEFQDVLRAFKKQANLTSEEEDEFRFTTIQDLQSAILRIRGEQWTDRRLRALNRLDPILKTLQQYGQVVEVFVNAADMVAFIWGPMKFLLEVSSTFLEAFNKLLDAYQHIGESMPLVLQYLQLFHESPYMRKILVLIYQDLLEFHREALKYFKQRMWKKLFHALWRGFVTKIDTLVRNMRSHQELLNSQVNIVQFEQIQLARRETDKHFTILKETELTRRRIATYQWLAAANVENIHSRAVNVRSTVPLSGHWILDNKRFREWFQPDFCQTPSLWLNGSPGIGKTVLASLIVEEIRNLRELPMSNTEHSTLAYFYCKCDDPERSTFLSVARGVLAHLLSQHDDLLQYFYEMSSKSGEVSLSNPVIAKELLDTALGLCNRAYIVIDGIDECSREERKEIATVFQKYIQSLPRTEYDRVRCLFISQDDGYGRKDFSTIPSLKITKNDNEGDIEAYAKIWDAKIKVKFGLEDQCDIQNTITKAADGMFLYVTLVAKHLYDQSSPKDLKTELHPDIFPKEIGQVYERILKRLLENTGSSQQAASRTLLGWLVGAKRRMKWREIQGAVSIDLQEMTIDVDRRFVDSSKDLAGSLVELLPDGSVDLVHSTAKQYLIDSGFIKSAEIQYQLTQLCIGYLNLPYLQIPEIKAAEDEHVEILLDGYYSFLEYGTAFWAVHLEDIDITRQSDSSVKDLSRYLDAFLAAHFRHVDPKLAISNTLRARLVSFKDSISFPQLLQAVAFSKKQIGSFSKGTSEDDTLDLLQLLACIRLIFEDLDSSEILQEYQRAKLVDLYGKNWFKCPRVNCKFFHEGFEKRGERDNHVARHERAYFCSFEGCPSDIIGFASSKELEKHLFEDHEVINTDKIEFPKINKPQPKAKGHLSCPHCELFFTRKYNLDSHVRTRHGNDHKIFTCLECQKSFKRTYDLERHKKTHSGEKEHECGGSLKNGDSWGCGIKFSRADKLKQHHQSDTGRRCLQPKVDEEAQQETDRLEEEARQILEQSNMTIPTIPDKWFDDIEEIEKYRKLASKHAEILKRIQEADFSSQQSRLSLATSDESTPEPILSQPQIELSPLRQEQNSRSSNDDD